MEIRERVCRLCLKISESEFYAVEVFEETFNYLQLTLDMDLSNEPIVCENCSRDLQQCFSFKAKCLYTENRINLSEKMTSNVKMDLQDIYHSEEVNETLVNIPNDHVICRFCLELAKCGKDLEIEDVEVVILLGRYFPELNLYITENLITCIPCYESLQHYFNFVSNCLAAEEKIKTYGKGKSQVDLRNLMNFTSQAALKEEASDAVCNVGRQEEVQCGNSKVEVKLENVMEVVKQELEMEDENVADAGIACDSSQDRTLLLQPKADILTPNMEIPQTSVDVQSKISSFEAPHSNLNGENVSLTVKKIHQCNTCSLSHQCKTCSLIHQNISEVHTYKCEECDYQTKVKVALRSHMLGHRSSSEATRYNCDFCGFHTKYRESLKQHMVVHNRARKSSNFDLHSGLIYKCYVCRFQTNLKQSLSKHMRVHSTARESKNCDSQPGGSKSLQGRMLTREDMLELPKYNCQSCEFRTHDPGNFQKHVLNHMSYKCNSCEYSTKYVSCLRAHMHQSHTYIPVGDLAVNEETSKRVYKCSICPLESTNKYNFNRHIQAHDENADVTMYSCDMCGYQTKVKGYLTKHSMCHKENPKTT